MKKSSRFLWEEVNKCVIEIDKKGKVWRNFLHSNDWRGPRYECEPGHDKYFWLTTTHVKPITYKQAIVWQAYELDSPPEVV